MGTEYYCEILVNTLVKFLVDTLANIVESPSPSPETRDQQTAGRMCTYMANPERMVRDHTHFSRDNSHESVDDKTLPLDNVSQQ